MPAITFNKDPRPAITFGGKEFCTLHEEKPGYFKGWLPGPGDNGKLVIFIPTGIWKEKTLLDEIKYLNELWAEYRELPSLPEKRARA